MRLYQYRLIVTVRTDIHHWKRKITRKWNSAISTATLKVFLLIMCSALVSNSYHLNCSSAWLSYVAYHKSTSIMTSRHCKKLLSGIFWRQTNFAFTLSRRREMCLTVKVCPVFSAYKPPLKVWYFNQLNIKYSYFVKFNWLTHDRTLDSFTWILK